MGRVSVHGRACVRVGSIEVLFACALNGLRRQIHAEGEILVCVPWGRVRPLGEGCSILPRGGQHDTQLLLGTFLAGEVARGLVGGLVGVMMNVVAVKSERCG